MCATPMTLEAVGVLGVFCIVAAIAGGGLKAAGVDFPVLKSLVRQVILAGFGVVLIIVSRGVPVPGNTASSQAVTPILTQGSASSTLGPVSGTGAATLTRPGALPITTEALLTPTPKVGVVPPHSLKAGPRP